MSFLPTDNETINGIPYDEFFVQAQSTYKDKYKNMDEWLSALHSMNLYEFKEHKRNK